MSEQDIDRLVEKTEPGRREAIRSMLLRSAFVAPVVATFAMGGLSVRQAHAYGSNL